MTIQKKVYLISTEKSWIEGDALRQLEQTAALPGMVAAVGLPDLHPGPGGPVGAVFLNEDTIYPHLIGTDVGCGIGLWKTSLKKRKLNRDKWIKKLDKLEECEEDPDAHHPPGPGGISSFADQAFGTIGGGNHFAELQLVEKVYDNEAFQALQLVKDRLFLLIHSGSRGLGSALLQHHADRYGGKGLYQDSDEAVQYLAKHDHAISWAALNRARIAGRMSRLLGGTSEPVLDHCHNHIVRVQLDELSGWLHRKGATPSSDGPVVIPGSRGAFSYLVKPLCSDPSHGFSLAHGAGRKWNRSSCKGRIKQMMKPADLRYTPLGGRVICDDRELLCQEAPQAYKNIEIVIDDMVQAGLISIIATLRPVITYKQVNRK